MADASDILAAFALAAPSWQKAAIRDTGYALTDREKYLVYSRSKKLDLAIAPGTPLKAGTAVVRAMTERRRVVIRGDKATFGIPYIAMAYPITTAAGEVVGGFVILESTEEQDLLREMADQLNGNISLLASTTEEISAQTEEIAAVANRLTEVTRQSQERVKETDQVLNLIKGIANQTNLLGLNAAIEAARVGDAGSGFGVVAEEIRKLASTTAESIKKIEIVVKTIQTDSADTYQQLAQMKEVVTQVAGAVTHVAGAVEETNGLARRLSAMADSLSQAD
jgi:methyl-accepting chemotaxis protein